MSSTPATAPPSVPLPPSKSTPSQQYGCHDVSSSPSPLICSPCAQAWSTPWTT
ncbi:hypothetical protein [Streptomyces sp. NPDC006784]|uniref:hypothetical protein n=1 Tax=Streptomyces sp. NPDC006784 TaxID=3364764 RepID=UPI0036A41341